MGNGGGGAITAGFHPCPLHHGDDAVAALGGEVFGMLIEQASATRTAQQSQQAGQGVIHGAVSGIRIRQGMRPSGAPNTCLPNPTRQCHGTPDGSAPTSLNWHFANQRGVMVGSRSQLGRPAYRRTRTLKW